MTNRMWVTLLYLFARQSHQSCLIPWPVEQYVRDTGLLLCQAASSMISSHDQQDVGDTVQALCLCQAASSIMSHHDQQCVSDAGLLLSILGSLVNHALSHDQQDVNDAGGFINHVWASSHYQQGVSDTALFVCQAVSLITSHPLPTGCEWYCFICLPDCLMNWHVSSASEWHCFICLCSLINHVSSRDPQYVSNTTLFLCQAVSLIMSHPMTNSEWVTLLYFFARQSHESCLIPWPMVCEWHCFNCLPGCLINHHVSSCYQQHVSETALIVCHAV